MTWVFYGIQVAATASPSKNDLEIQRAQPSSAGSTSPGSFNTIATVPNPGEQSDFIENFSYQDILPNDNVRRFYRCRMVRTGYAPSTWLGVIDAKPDRLFG